MLIGSITNQGSLQGEMNNANGYLTGVITNAGQLGGQVVGLRGLKGDKGDTGNTGATGNGIASVTYVSSSGLVDTYKITFTNGTETTFDVTNGEDGIDGIDGVDGHSPVVTASKVGKVTTVSVDGSAIATINDGNDGQDGSDGQDGADGYSPSASVSKVGTTATITITDKDGTTTAEIHDGSGGGASAFIAEYGVTSYADVKDAYDEDAIILCTVDDSGNTAICQLAYYDDANDVFSFAQPVSEGFYLASIASDDTWSDGYFQFASTDTATQLRDGLMSALDWQKLDGIESGAEVNVQSDWNAISGDAQILNKPTIPSKTSDLNNDSGFITGMTILSYGNSTWQNFIDAYNANKVVYCRASSNANPATGSQTRLAFMAYVNNESSPTEVEFQYYRSVSSHSASQQGDQVFVYKLNKTNGWSVTTREAASKIVAGTGLSSSYSSGVLTLTSSGEANVQSDWSQSDATADDYIKNKPSIPSQPSDIGAQPTLVSGTNIKTINNTPLLGSGNITVSAEDEIFVCEYGDTTFADALVAYNAGKRLVCHYNDGANDFYAWLELYYSAATYFEFEVTSGDKHKEFYLDSNGWTRDDISASAIPIARRISKFNSDSRINSTDMTTGSGGEVESFVDGLNVTGFDLVEDISNKFTFTSAWTGLIRSAYKIGKLVVFSLEGNSGTVVAGAQYTMVTIESGYRPKTTTYYTGHGTNASYLPQGIVNSIAWTSGDLTVRPQTNTCNYIFVSGVYVLP